MTYESPFQDKAAVECSAKRYPDGVLDDARKMAKKKGFLTREMFLELCRWKSARILGYARNNSSQTVKQQTENAFASEDDCDSINHLLSPKLQGVRYPMASVILHAAHRKPYPIVDIRALTALLGCEKASKVNHNRTFWCGYVAYCRKIADEFGVDMRKLDQALFESGGKKLYLENES